MQTSFNNGWKITIKTIIKAFKYFTNFLYNLNQNENFYLRIQNHLNKAFFLGNKASKIKNVETNPTTLKKW